MFSHNLLLQGLCALCRVRSANSVFETIPYKIGTKLECPPEDCRFY